MAMYGGNILNLDQRHAKCNETLITNKHGVETSSISLPFLSSEIDLPEATYAFRLAPLLHLP